MIVESDSTLHKLQHIAEQRKKLRQLQGAIDIEFPEIVVKVENGAIHFNPVPHTQAAHIVQELMILAGEAAARWAYMQNLAFPYVTQEPPISEERAGSGLGPTSSLAENYARRRMMRAAIVSSTCSAHAGLGLSFYSQVTSPLRRYHDLLAHYQISASINERTPLSAEALETRLYRASLQIAKTDKQREIRANIGQWRISIKTATGKAPQL